MTVPETERLRFRNYNYDDLDWLIEMCADPDVMRYFETTLDKEGTRALYDRLKGHIDEHGFGFWVAEMKATDEPIGMIGLGHPRFDPTMVEIGWRLRKKYWNQGLATEGAIECLKFGFEQLQLDKIWSCTAIDNYPSYHVMEKIGMSKSHYFDHPNVTKGHPIEPHVMYVLERYRYMSTQPSLR